MRRRRAAILAAFLVAPVLAACAGEVPVSSGQAGEMSVSPRQAGEARTLEYQGVARHYYVHNIEVPAPAPLVVSLHGYRDKEQALAERDQLSEIAWESLSRMTDREGFIVAYPHAWLGRWSLFEGLENITLEDGRRVDDVGFVFTMITRLVAEGLADPKRVYLTGFSDGAIMSYRLLCSANAPFATAAPTGGTMYQPHRDACAAATPTPLLVIMGTNDWILPYDGWLFPTGRGLSISETLEHFLLLHGCTGQKADLLYDRDTKDDSRVREVVWTGCRVEDAVKLLRVEGGGHNWPSYEPIPDEWRTWAGVHNRDIESAEEIWAFLRRFEGRPGAGADRIGYEILGPFDADKVPFVSGNMRESVREDFVGDHKSEFTLAVCESGCAAWSWGGSWTTQARIRNVLQRCERSGRKPCGLVAVNGELVTFKVQPTQITYPGTFDSSAVPFVRLKAADDLEQVPGLWIAVRAEHTHQALGRLVGQAAEPLKSEGRVDVVA